MAHVLHLCTRLRPSEPVRLACGPRASRWRKHSARRERGLQRNQRPAGADELREGVVEFARLRLQDSQVNVDASRPQPRNSATTNLWIGIDRRDHDAPHASRNQCVGARAGAAVMAARLQGDIRGRAGEIGDAFARVAQRNDLCVVAFVINMRALADDLAIAD